MKIAITGASGYVGGGLSNGFRSHGHEVVALSRRPCPAPWVHHSLGDDPRQLPWDGVEVLIHAAYDFTARTWQEIQEQNVAPSIALLLAARNAGVRCLIYISSMSSFENCHSNYGKAKWIVEKNALALGAIVVRPGLVWSETSGGVMGTLEKLVSRLPIVPFLIGGKNLHQFLIHEADLSAAIVAIAETIPPMNGLLHSAIHPTSVSLLAILKSIARRSNLSRLYLPVPWQFVMAALKTLEMLGIHCSFRSDSLTGLVQGNPHPEITDPPAGVHYRPFG